MDGITPISEADMGNYFKKNLKQTDTLIGTYDNSHKDYNLTLAPRLAGENLVENSSVDSSLSESSILLTNSNLVLNPDITNFTPVTSPSIDLNNNIFINEVFNATTEIKQYPPIGIGELIAETTTATTTITTPRNFSLKSYNDGVLYNQGFNPGNWGAASDPNDPINTWSSTSGTARDPFSEKTGNTHAERQYELKVTYDNRFASSTGLTFPDSTNSQTGNAVNEDGDIWWYNGTHDNGLGFFNTEWPAIQTELPGSGTIQSGASYMSAGNNSPHQGYSYGGVVPSLDTEANSSIPTSGSIDLTDYLGGYRIVNPTAGSITGSYTGTQRFWFSGAPYAYAGFYGGIYAQITGYLGTSNVSSYCQIITVQSNPYSNVAGTVTCTFTLSHAGIYAVETSVTVDTLKLSPIVLAPCTFPA